MNWTGNDGEKKTVTTFDNPFSDRNSEGSRMVSFGKQTYTYIIQFLEALKQSIRVILNTRKTLLFHYINQSSAVETQITKINCLIILHVLAFVPLASYIFSWKKHGRENDWKIDWKKSFFKKIGRFRNVSPKKSHNLSLWKRDEGGKWLRNFD